MRLVRKEVMDRYGCGDCADSKWVCGTIFECKHQECPYEELNEYQTYEQFLDSFSQYDAEAVN